MVGHFACTLMPVPDGLLRTENPRECHVPRCGGVTDAPHRTVEGSAAAIVASGGSRSGSPELARTLRATSHPAALRSGRRPRAPLGTRPRGACRQMVRE